MRPITLQHSDYDALVDERWVQDVPSYLLTPHIVLSLHHEGFSYYHFSEAIGEQQSVVKSDTAKIISVTIQGVRFEEINLAELAVMSVKDLGIKLATQII